MARKPLDRDFTAQVTGLSHDGRGVAHRNGKAVFINGALPGETVRAKQTGRSRHFDQASILEVLEASEQRIDPQCAHYALCSGCVLQHLQPDQQLLAKQSVLVESLSRIGHVQAEQIFEPLRGPLWGYRRKGRFSVRWVDKKGKSLVGFREENPKFVADLSHCHTLVPQIGTRISALSSLIDQLEARASIPQIEFVVGDAAIALVIRHLQALSIADRNVLIQFAKDSGFALFLQPQGVESVHALWPAQVDLYFDLAKHNVRLHFRPLDFIQVNAQLNEQMIDRALQLLQPTKTDRVLDLFCGLGNFTLPLARQVAHIVGVEGDPGLIQRANNNATANQIHNARFYSADLSKPLNAEAWLQQGFDKLLLDPPRAGAAEVLAQLPLKAIQRIVYVSCHPASLARDAGFLVRERGYRLLGAGVMDMFPHTAHVESIAVFER